MGSVGLRRFKMLGVAVRKRNIQVALHAVGLGRVARGAPRLYMPQTSAATRHLKGYNINRKARRRK